MRYDELTLGMTASRADQVTVDTIRAFAAVSGDDNPLHVDAGIREALVVRRHRRARHPARGLRLRGAGPQAARPGNDRARVLRNAIEARCGRATSS